MEGSEIKTFTQKCSKCKRAISAEFEFMHQFIDFIKSQGWVMAWFGWCCPEHAKNLTNAEKI